MLMVLSLNICFWRLIAAIGYLVPVPSGGLQFVML